MTEEKSGGSTAWIPTKANVAFSAGTLVTIVALIGVGSGYFRSIESKIESNNAELRVTNTKLDSVVDAVGKVERVLERTQTTANGFSERIKALEIRVENLEARVK